MHYRHSDSSEGDYAVSPHKELIDPEFSGLLLEDLEVITTLGMGGFGRVELVSKEIQ